MVIGLTSFSAFSAVSVFLAIMILFAPLERTFVGVLGLAMTVSLMMLGVHIAVSMALPAVLGLWAIGGERSIIYAFEAIPHDAAASWTLSVVPMFVLMGLVMHRTGMTTVVFDAAKQWIAFLPGGLAVTTIFAGAGMSAVSGSTLGVTYATSRLAIPEMLKAGYSKSFATGTVAMAGVLKMLIPPSVTVVIYAGIAETPVGPQLLAGIVPGLVLAGLFAVSIVIRTRLNSNMAPAIDTTDHTWKTRLAATGRTWPAFVLVGIISGGLYSGTTTATESGALAALAAILIGGWLTRGEGLRAYLKAIGEAIAQTVAAVATIMLLIISVAFLTLFITLTGVVQEISTYITSLGLTRVEFLLVLVVMFIILGMFMDELAMMLLTVPILLPILAVFDVDLIWFGVFLILLCEVGMVVPPVGFLSFVVHGIAQRPEVNLGSPISLVDVFRGVFWYVVVAIGLIVFLIFVPELALWLPNLSE
ncbi:TRAP transporter large permease [Nocardia rhamnosiphila]